MMSTISKLSKTQLFVGVLVLVIGVAAVGIGGSALMYKKYKDASSKLAELQQNPQAMTQNQSKELIAKVAMLMAVPNDEDPTIATVVDKEKLKGQAFFTSVENGDRVLFYPKAHKAILYRESDNKIMDVEPLNIGSASGQVAGAQAPQQSQAVPVVLYNGTTQTGLTNTIEAFLKKKATNVIVTTKQNAQKTDYTKTTVVDLTGKYSEVAGQLATLVNGQVGALPDGEKKPADPSTIFLVILGTDSAAVK